MLLTERYKDKIKGTLSCYDRIQSIIEKRGKQPGLVHIFSAMEISKLGKCVITLGLKTRELFIIPGLTEAAAN